jgi:signal transduction histidine kinase/ligand-binding sensor domain-containing protein/ActR/RegA family two-component response regulator
MRALKSDLPISINRIFKRISEARAAGAALVSVRYLAVFLCLLFLGTAIRVDSYAADYASEYSGIVYNIENKLGSSEVNAIVQIDDGYMWIGTYTGLYQFNGNSFTKLELDDRIHSVMSLLPNGRDGIWIGTNDAGLLYYSFKTGEVISYTTADGLGSNSVRSLCYGKSGELYIGTNSYLSVLSEDNVLTTYAGSADLYYIRDISCRADGSIAVVSNGGTVFIIKDGVISQSFKREDAGSSFTSVKYMSGGNLMMGGSDGVIFIGHVTGNNINVEKYKDASYVGSVSKMYENKEGNLIIAGDAGLGFFDQVGRFHNIYRSDFNNSICGLCEDYQGNLWACSSRQGILKLSKNPFTNIFSVAGIENKVVNCIINKDGYFYIGCDDGLVILSASTYKQIDNEALDILNDVRIRHIYEDTDGNLWISTYSPLGLVFYDGEEAKSITKEDNGLSGNKVRLVTQLSNGEILVATSTGLSYIKDGEVIRTVGAEEGIEVEQILCLYETEDGKVYAGSDGGGVYVLEDGEVVDCINEKQGLTGLVILRMVSYGDDMFFVTGSDIFLYNDGACKALRNFPHSNNYDIIFSADGKAWVTSSAGVYIVSEKDLAKDSDYIADLLNTSRGLNTTLIANSWNYRDASDHVYLCCATGVKMIQMQSYSVINDDFDVDIREVKLDDAAIEPDEAGVYQITSDTKRITFTPAILNYSLANPYVRMYLEGFEDDGIIVSQSDLSEVSYTNLSFGNYVFHIQVLDNYMNVVKEKTVVVHRQARITERYIFWVGLVLVVIIVLMAVTWAIAERRNNALIKSQYNQIEKAKEEAEKTSEYKTQFLANMSHEIRTPINTIMGMDELILRENVSSQVRQYANDIYISGDSLLNIVNDILDLSKIESGKMNLVEVDYSTSDMLKELGHLLKVKANEAKLSVILDFDEKLPEKLHGDNNRIKQIITNLITNAVKYTEEGSVTFKVECLGEAGGNADIRVSVIDTGIGIKPEDMNRLFVEFERLDEERNHNVKGTGLGLAITKQLLELMNSRLEVDSIYGEGSNFFFTITQKVVNSDTIGSLDVTAEGEDEFVAYKPSFIAPDVSILVVDDTPLNLAVIRGLLRSTQVHIDTGESGLVALEKVKQRRYDLILLDHMMPEMDGIETLEQLSRTNHKCMGVPVIVLTANAIAGAKENYLKIGFTDYLSKPVSGKDLEAMLKRYLPPSKVREPDREEEKQASKPEGAGEEGFGKVRLVNPDKGRSYCAGDSELYKSVLGLFVEEYETEPANLQKYLTERDGKKFVTHAHKLKSSARTIGADELFEKAKDLEDEGKAENWDAIKRKLSSVMELYLDVVMEIKNKML